MNKFPPLSFPWNYKTSQENSVAMAFVSSSELLAIASRIHWEFHDLVIAYDMLRQTLIERDRSIQVRVDEMKKNSDNTCDEIQGVMKARFLEDIRAEDMMLAQINRTSVRSIVVNSWILVESTLGEAYSVLLQEISETSTNSKSYRWDQLSFQFSEAGISLTNLSGFENANLCRMVNNAIKHAGKVSETMSQSDQFSQAFGKQLRNIDILPQPLVTGAHSFCMDLLERVQEKIDTLK
ncbi:hypothetical protein [Sulfitobacter pontiacus]|uniref:hypothetical protein n=1 Tax=Sulfitobacter pontiacus TaxID=60137 RepID=UPI0036DD78FF